MRADTAVRLAVVAMLLALAALFSSRSDGASLTLTRVCDGYRLAQRSDGLSLYCPGKAAPFLTFAGCLKARAIRQGAEVTITCGEIIVMEPPQPKRR